LPANISSFGATVEEINLQHGTPDPNPVVAPMASPKVPEVRLALGRGGSDQIRLGGPAEPVINPYEGAQPTLVLSRKVVQKLDSSVISQLQQSVEGELVGDQNLRGLMQDSLRRVLGLREFVDGLNKMTESIYVRSIAASKG
jgi:hypothetical protein